MTEARCRFCDAALHDVFVDLGRSPLSNALVEAAHLDEPEAMYPLRAYVCRSCWLVQVPPVTSREHIFGDYVYRSSYSTTWLDHVTRFAERARTRFALSPSSLVVEVASNDGHLLRRFAEAGVGVLGIEPAANVAQEAVDAGIPTEVAFFGAATAQRLVERGKRAALLVANNVLAHVPDLNDFVAGMRSALAPGGVVSLEFPHLLRTIEGGEFDTIYHEHLSYFSLGTAQRVLESHGLEIFDAEELPTHGGSLRVYAGVPGAHPRGHKPEAILAAEDRAGLKTIDAYMSFAARAGQTKAGLQAFFAQAAREGKTVAGYGAPAKATTLLNYCGIGPLELPYTVDRSPHKQGKYLPGVRVPIAPPERIAQTKPDYVLILPWNIKEEIERQMAIVRSWGGRFVVPIPAVEVR